MVTKEMPILYKRKEECCGCTACYAICPKEAICMAEDEEGFEYPQINDDKCIDVKVAFEGLKGEKTKGLKAALKFAKEHDMCMTEAQIQGANNM